MSQSQIQSSASTTRQSQRNSDKQYFFDSTLKENRGTALHKRMSIEGFAIYIDSGPDTMLLSYPRTYDKDGQLARTEAPTQE